MTESLPVLALVRDLMFSSRISATARAANVPFQIVRDPARLVDAPESSLLMVDLNLEGAIPAAGQWRDRTGGRVIGFVSHTDAATIQAARDAQISEIFARSAFVQILPRLLGAE